VITDPVFYWDQRPYKASVTPLSLVQDNRGVAGSIPAPATHKGLLTQDSLGREAFPVQSLPIECASVCRPPALM